MKFAFLGGSRCLLSELELGVCKLGNFLGAIREIGTYRINDLLWCVVWHEQLDGKIVNGFLRRYFVRFAKITIGRTKVFSGQLN